MLAVPCRPHPGGNVGCATGDACFGRSVGHSENSPRLLLWQARQALLLENPHSTTKLRQPSPRQAHDRGWMTVDASLP
jgi:hypothetical protein